MGPEGDPLNTARGILITKFHKANKTYCLINTHFTWTPNGQDSEQQHVDLKNLFRCLDKFPDYILCGDFKTNFCICPFGFVIREPIVATQMI